MTLEEIIKEHPDWINYPVAVLRSDGLLDYVGASGNVNLLQDEEDGKEFLVVVFNGN